MSKPAVFGIVDNETQARQALLSLETAGFASSDVSILSRNAEHPNALEQGLGTRATSTADGNVRHENTTKAPEGTTAGVVAGGVAGGIVGWLLGIGALAIPGVGPFIAAGPILAALSGAAIVATAGGIVGALVGSSTPENSMPVTFSSGCTPRRMKKPRRPKVRWSRLRPTTSR
jgi:hypothetical protein